MSQILMQALEIRKTQRGGGGRVGKVRSLEIQKSKALKTYI